MSLKTEDVFYLYDRHRALVDNREEAVAGIRRAGWRVVGGIALVLSTLTLLLILQPSSKSPSTEGFSNMILLYVIVYVITMLMILRLFGVPYRKRTQLFAEGEILKGTIDKIMTLQYRDRQTTAITYHFQTTLGEKLEGAIDVRERDRNPGPAAATMTYHMRIISDEMRSGIQSYTIDDRGLPESGTTVTVLYRTNKHYMVL